MKINLRSVSLLEVHRQEGLKEVEIFISGTVKYTGFAMFKSIMFARWILELL